VFIKEARPHTGVRSDGATAQQQLLGEWATLQALHVLVPGLAPEPIVYFSEGHHDFLVSEHVEGLTLRGWTSTPTNPIHRVEATTDEFVEFYNRCEKIMDALEEAIDRLHAAGYLFVDVSPSNVIVGADDLIRLIDFGEAQRMGDAFRRAGTPGFTPPEHLVGNDLTIYDRFGLSRLAQYLTGPFQQVLDHNPGALAHARRDLDELSPIPPGLWKRATKFHVDHDDHPWPTPEQVAADPIGQLTNLRDKVAAAVVATAEVGNEVRVFPTIVQGYLTNTACIAYGTAGVIHALRRAGRDLPEGVLDMLRKEALEKANDLGPGLFVGSAGIARVLADCGLADEARDVLALADHHPLTSESATLFGGSAGVALAHLGLYGITNDEHHIDRATALVQALPPDDQLTPHLGPDDAVGLMHGRTGIALMLQQLATVTGDSRYLARAITLLHTELNRAPEPEAPGLRLPVSATDHRLEPSLEAGSAGVAFTASRCLQAVNDERLTEALPRLLAPLHRPFAAQAGLFHGLSGHAFTLADHATRTGDTTSHEKAQRIARSLFKHGIPHQTGVRFLGDRLLRFSTELCSGSAGVLLALTEVLNPRPDALFTVDKLIHKRTVSAGE
jgi:hypothetical protein